MNRRFLAIILALIMAASLITACGQGQSGGAATTAATTAQAAEQTTAAATTTAATTTTTQTTTTAAPELPYVELTFYMMGEVGQDMDKFQPIFDEWTLRDLNCKVNWKFANTWIDYAAKYNLMLTADDTIDMCYAASWVDFYAYAKKDAFEDITDMLPVCAPDVWANYPREQFNGATVNGKIYGVPQNWTNYHGNNFVYREDLRKKYSLPEMTLDYDAMENYLKTVLENEPGFQFAVTYLYSDPVSMFTPRLTKYIGIDATAVGMLNELGTNNTILYYETPEYLEFAERMKKWSDMGFWSKSILATADSTDPPDLFKEGLIFASFSSHLDRSSGVGEEVAKVHPEWEINALPYAELSGNYFHTRTAQDLTVIPNGSKNPERSLMVLNKLLSDKQYYDLTQYGIKDLNYEVDDEGYISFVNIDNTAHGFTINLWATRNNDLAYPEKRLWDRKGYEDKVFPKLKYDPFDGFAIDLNDVQAEYSAVYQVMKEYGDPIQWGLVSDPAAAIETLKQKMKEAGMDRFKAEMDRQIAAYFDSRK